MVTTQVNQLISYEMDAGNLDLLQILPTEIIFNILGWLDLTSLCLCRRLSRKWRGRVNGYLGSVNCLDFVPFETMLTEDGLKHMLTYVSNLRVLHLDSCWPCVTEENLFVIAMNCSKLSVFTASRCKGVTDAALEAVARYCKKLTELDLSSCFNVCKWESTFQLQLDSSILLKFKRK